MDLIIDASYKWKQLSFHLKYFQYIWHLKLDEISSKIVWIDADNICIQ